MKKGKILKTLAIAGTCLCAPLLLSGCTKDAESKVEFRVQDGYIQVTEDGTTWKNLVDVDDLKGEPGQPGQPGQAVDGKQVEFQVTATHIQWRYVGESDSAWKDLVELENLKGEPGKDGEDTTYSTYTVTYDYGKANTYFKTQQTSDAVKSTEWVTTLPEIKPEYADAFTGWFIEGTEKQIENYDFVGGNVTLEARFDIEKLSFSGLYQNGKYVMTWDDIKTVYPDAIVAGEIKNTSDRSYFENLIGDLIIDDEVTIFGDYSFAYCDNLTSIIIPTNVTNIGEYSFIFCDKINNIIIPASVESIGDSAFWGCGLTSITIPASVTNIGYNAFRGCGELTSIIVEEENAIYDSRENCNAIIVKSTNTLVFGCKETIIPTSVKDIGPYAFMGHYGLTSITIPTGVTSIGASAFRGCTNLTSIIIPASVTSIGDYAFGEHCGLKNVYYQGTSTDWGDIDTISTGNDSLTEATIYYYIEDQEDIPNDNGNYWHYDTDSKTPIIWDVTE